METGTNYNYKVLMAGSTLCGGVVLGSGPKMLQSFSIEVSMDNQGNWDISTYKECWRCGAGVTKTCKALIPLNSI
jgi:hypothetical protein